MKATGPCGGGGGGGGVNFAVFSFVCTTENM